MKRIYYLCLGAILFAAFGCGIGEPIDAMEFPLTPTHWQIEAPRFPQSWCLGLCPDYEAFR